MVDPAVENNIVVMVETVGMAIQRKVPLQKGTHSPTEQP